MLLRLPKGEVNSDVGHRHYHAGDQELDKHTEDGVNFFQDWWGETLSVKKDELRIKSTDLCFNLVAIGSVLEDHLNFRIDEERDWEYDTQEQTNQREK